MVVHRIGADDQVDVNDGKQPNQVHDDCVNQAEVTDANPVRGHSQQLEEPVGLIHHRV